jgi:hypothetical protein
MKVQTVTVNNDSYPLSFGSAALAAFLDSVGATLNDLQTGEFGQKLTYRHTLQATFYAMQDGFRREKREFTLTFDDVCDLIDDCPELLETAMDVFQQSVGGENKETGKAKGAKAPRR